MNRREQIQQIDAAIAEIHLMADLGQGLDRPRLAKLEERRAALVARQKSIGDSTSGPIEKPVKKYLELSKGSSHRGSSRSRHETPVKIDAAVYIRLDKPRSGKWLNLLVRPFGGPKRTYYPAFGVARGEFTDSDDFRRMAKRYPELVPALEKLISQKIPAQQGKEEK